MVFYRAVFLYTLRYIIGFVLVKMGISTNPKPTIYRDFCENTGMLIHDQTYAWGLPSTHETSTQCWFHVGPASSIQAQHENSIESTSRVCWIFAGLTQILHPSPWLVEITICTNKIWVNVTEKIGHRTNTMCWTDAGLMLGQRRDGPTLTQYRFNTSC